MSQEGPLNDLYERNGFNTSFVQRLLDNDLKLTLVAKFVQDEYAYANEGAINAAISFDPTQPVFDENGKILRNDPSLFSQRSTSYQNMEKDGKQIFVWPCISIPAKSIKILKIPDITKYHKNNIHEGG